MPLVSADITIPVNTPQTLPVIVTDTTPTADLNVSWQAEV